ncbi:MlaD family protein [Candidatus Venteria ishoeyi]|uniref:Mce related protein n=1 Tax=Candidatus Venteria ishoeyi TaxID=1899563 RepID=A0A1H6FI58_9GAMM|nr:MlaD family protein [Candidatus Venteria ishoeyi]SEH08735.1 mce related protein [Candidatus Venteria ishoeyi]
METKTSLGEQHYIHHVRYSFQERIVGVFVFFAPLVLIFLFVVNSETQYLFEEHIDLYILLQNAGGVSTETPVRISGIEVGRVTVIELSDDNRIRLTLSVRKRFLELLRTDSKAALGTLSLLGKAVIEISPGDKNLALLKQGAYLQAKEQKTLEDIINETQPIVETIRTTIVDVAQLIRAIDPQQVTGITEDISVTAKNLRLISQHLLQVELIKLEAMLDTSGKDLVAIIHRISAGKGSLGKLLFDEALANNLEAAIIQVNRVVETVNQMLQALQPLLRDSSAITRDVRKASATLPITANEVHKLVVQLNTLLASLSGELQQFPQLMTQLKLLIEDTDRLLMGIQRIWPVSSTLEVPKRDLLTIPLPINE